MTIKSKHSSFRIVYKVISVLFEKNDWTFSLIINILGIQPLKNPLKTKKMKKRRRRKKNFGRAFPFKERWLN